MAERTCSVDSQLLHFPDSTHETAMPPRPVFLFVVSMASPWPVDPVERPERPAERQVVGNGSGEVMETMKGLFAARASLAEGGR